MQSKTVGRANPFQQTDLKSRTRSVHVARECFSSSVADSSVSVRSIRRIGETGCLDIPSAYDDIAASFPRNNNLSIFNLDHLVRFFDKNVYERLDDSQIAALALHLNTWTRGQVQSLTRDQFTDINYFMCNPRVKEVLGARRIFIIEAIVDKMNSTQRKWISSRWKVYVECARTGAAVPPAPLIQRVFVTARSFLIKLLAS